MHDPDLVPAHGPVILAPNHTGFLDPPLLMGTSPRPIHCLAKREIFRGPLGWFLRSIGQIPLDRSGTDRTALTSALAVLSAGRVLVVYPEGTRGSGNFADMRRGLAWLAVRSGAPVVPVVAFGVGSRGTTLSALPRVRIPAGRRVRFSGLLARGDRALARCCAGGEPPTARRTDRPLLRCGGSVRRPGIGQPDR